MRKYKVGDDTVIVDDDQKDIVDNLVLFISFSGASKKKHVFARPPKEQGKKAEKQKLLHQILYGNHRPLIIYFKNGDALDLRRENIEYITRKEQYHRTHDGVRGKSRAEKLPIEFVYCAIIGYEKVYKNLPDKKEAVEYFGSEIVDWVCGEEAWDDVLKEAEIYKRNNRAKSHSPSAWYLLLYFNNEIYYSVQQKTIEDVKAKIVSQVDKIVSVFERNCANYKLTDKAKNDFVDAVYKARNMQGVTNALERLKKHCKNEVDVKIVFFRH